MESVTRHLGSKALGPLCYNNNPPTVHGFASAVHRWVRRSFDPSPTLMFCPHLEWWFVHLDRQLTGSALFLST
ncbi:hypothetical protein HAX54_045818, partial [Datura stramonium]|nr:hypothetical protein [Datura stramonium]